MKVEFLQQFLKDIDRLQDPVVRAELVNLIERLESAPSLREIPQVKKLKGFKTAYRIRLKQYRVGFYYDNGVIELVRCLDRRDIYRRFP
ncbi:MAG: type II toxin-antitoxin system RelE/ParE family toxin [Bacteroidetes bacterium]|nr:type II toxin-antitoxin system RelE/ParE family toxin [Bacteroidota bacterium]